MYNPYDPYKRNDQMPIMNSFIPPQISPYSPFNPFNQTGPNFNGPYNNTSNRNVSNYTGPRNNFVRHLWNNNEFKKEVKNEVINYANDRMEEYNQRSDNDFRSRHPGSQYDVFDKMNDGMTKALYFSDNYLGTRCVGHGIATAGRVTRNNYETYYERSPYTNPYDRAMDAYDKATNLDI